jgi:O-antigen biosynthesis protein WbqP
MSPAIVLRRMFDVSTCAAILVVLGPLILLIAFLIRLTSSGPVLFWSNRIGVNNTVFSMPKFRTMRTDAPIVATHLLAKPQLYLTPIGSLLRRFSLDELPQLVSILKGDIALVGPRPALFNQTDLIELRTKHGIHRLVPGLTGWAQVNGRDTLTIEQKVELDRYYLQHRSAWFDAKIILLTVLRVICGDGVTH